MILIKKIAPYFFLATLLFGIVFIWHQVPLPCQQPILYSIGNFDERFGLREGDFLKEIVAAEGLWENASGKTLFQYSSGAAFHVNLIFDERQKQTIAGQDLEVSLGNTESTQEKLNTAQGKTLASYNQAVQNYERSTASFKKRLDAYNSEVEKWNKEGSAPPEVYKNLQDVSLALKKSQKELEVSRQGLNRLVQEVNAFSQKKVAVVETYNEQVQEYVHRYGTTKEFDQGEYVGKEISIYQYDDLPHLRAVLVHELGHALGLTHGSDTASIMYPLMKDQSLNPLVLTAEDRMMLKTECSQTVWDIILERLSLLRERLKSAQTS